MKLKISRITQVRFSIVFFVVPQAFAIIQLNSPSDFSINSTIINFDDGSDHQAANTLYLDEGVEFSRDDGYNIAIYNWEDLGRTTTSAPNVLATVSGAISEHPVPVWSTHLNAEFAVPVTQVGAYFGNDQGGDFNKITLIAYGEKDALLGSVTLNANHNTSVDQFIGLSSEELIYSVRFQNNGTYYAVIIDDFIFTPVPEPATFSLFVLGAVCLRKKKK